MSIVCRRRCATADSKSMRALSIRQPYVEQILRGTKRVEYRSRRTGIIGETFYICAAKLPGDRAGFDSLGRRPGELPTGVIVGTARIVKCAPSTRSGPAGEAGGFEWHLADVRRLARPMRPARRPQPVWFRPF